MSALVWSVESVVIGLWALVFVQFVSNPLHTFVARTQLIIAGATLLMQLINTARVLPAVHAISEAYVSAVSGLFIAYLMVLLDPDNYSNPKLFSMGVFGGFLPIDACVALGWFSAALISGIGMALSERGRPSKLMFHHFGYHMLIVPPSFLVFWLYNYDGASTAEPLSQAVQFLYSGARITHFVYTLLLICIWGVFIVLQATGELLQFEAGRAPAIRGGMAHLRTYDLGRRPAIRPFHAAEISGARRLHIDPPLRCLHSKDNVAGDPDLGAGGRGRCECLRLVSGLRSSPRQSNRPR
jgi:hypothetical protein